MKKLIMLGFCILALVQSYLSLANENKDNVILLMVDGVRWQEVFQGSDPIIDPSLKEPILFKYLLNNRDLGSLLLGDKNHGSEYLISNSSMVSLPAYQSIMTGRQTVCRTNYCGRVEVETIQERILRELKLKKTEVATIASWKKIAFAVEKTEGQTFVNTGNQEITEGEINPITDELNKKQQEDSPSWDGRKDDYTFAQAINYLQNNKPRFLFISLNDSDEHAHQGKYLNYISDLKSYDNKFQILFNTLNQMGEYGQSTSVIITTDHGRGNLKNWKDHGPDSPESRFVWFYGRNPHIKKVKNQLSTVQYTHLDIRPTIEKLLGLVPLQCDKCGKIIKELIPD